MERNEEGTPLSIREHAAEWFLRLHAHDLNVAERFAYLQWLKASPVHIGETLQMCVLYSVLYPMKKQLFFTNEDDISNVIDLATREDTAPATRTRTSWRVRTLCVALAIGVVLIGGGIATHAWLDSRIETQASEWRSLMLNDGSFVSVGPRTELRDRFRDQRRLLSLSRGEALFQVAKDPARPFIVDAGPAVVRATGTRFAVSRRESGVTVTVEEGAVVVSDGAGRSGVISLTAAKQLTVSGAWPPAVREVDAARELAWSNRRLVFEDETVAAAAGEFNRRNRVQIVVDPAFAAEQVRGVFQADDPASFAEVVAARKNGVAVRPSRDVIRLQPQVAAPQTPPAASPLPLAP
ncbi:MAG TPA: FecR domain-containing protein [Steroidobacteraceae bacterium]|nr:FecR domain-containing protein [Steroidobacteraceae bacterium]